MKPLRKFFGCCLASLLLPVGGIARVQAEPEYKVINCRPAELTEKGKKNIAAQLERCGIKNSKWAFIYSHFDDTYLISHGEDEKSGGWIQFDAWNAKDKKWSRQVPAKAGELSFASNYLDYFVSLSMKGQVKCEVIDDMISDAWLTVVAKPGAAEITLATPGSQNANAIYIFNQLMAHAFDEKIGREAFGAGQMEQLLQLSKDPEAAMTLTKGLDFAVWFPKETPAHELFKGPILNEKVSEKIVGP